MDFVGAPHGTTHGCSVAQPEAAVTSLVLLAFAFLFMSLEILLPLGQLSFAMIELTLTVVELSFAVIELPFPLDLFVVVSSNRCGAGHALTHQCGVA